MISDIKFFKNYISNQVRGNITFLKKTITLKYLYNFY